MTEADIFCLFRSFDIDHLVSISQEFNNEVHLWYSSSPQQLLQCTGTSRSTGYFYGFCSMTSSFLQGKLVKAVVKFPDIQLVLSRVKEELCQCSIGTTCCNQRALKALRDRGGTPPTFKCIVASNLTPPKSPSTDDDEILDVTPDDVLKANAFRSTLTNKQPKPRNGALVQRRGNGPLPAAVTPRQKELLAHINVLNGQVRQNTPRPSVVPLVPPQKQRKVVVQGVPPMLHQPNIMPAVRPLPQSVAPRVRLQPNSVARAEEQLQLQLQKKNNMCQGIPVVKPLPKKLPAHPHMIPSDIHLAGRNAIQSTTSPHGNLASALAQINNAVPSSQFVPNLPSNSSRQNENGTRRAELRGPPKRHPPIRSQIASPAGVQTVKMAVMQNLAEQNKALAQMSTPGCSFLSGQLTLAKPVFPHPKPPHSSNSSITGPTRRGGYKRRGAEDDDYALFATLGSDASTASNASFRPKRSCTQVKRSIYGVDDESTIVKAEEASNMDEEDSEPEFAFLNYRKDSWDEYDLKKQKAKREPTEEEITTYDISVCKQCCGWVPKRERRNHALEFHGTQKRYRCEGDDCGFQTMNYEKAQNHLKKRHNFETRVFDWKMDNSFRAYGNEILSNCFSSDEPRTVRQTRRVINFTTFSTGERKKRHQLEEPSFQDICGPLFRV